MEEKIVRDMVVIGGGPGGYVAAIHAAHLGARVAVVERDRLGGTCLNRGCIPTKALVRSIEVFHEANRADDFGLEIPVVRADFPKVMARKSNIANQLVAGVGRLMKQNQIDVYQGTGRILSPHLVKVNDQEIEVGKIIIATGSRPFLLPIPGTDLPGVLTTDDILELKELPESLVVVGGSHVGVEFASIFNALGTKVTIVEMLPVLLPSIEAEIARRFVQTLSRRGITVKTGAAVKAIRRQGTLLQVLWDTQGIEGEAEGQMVLMATGRQPYTEGLGLAELGIKMERKAVAVNEQLETNVESVYAIGDVLGRGMLASVAAYEGEIAVENALGGSRRADYRVVPNVVYTYPVVAGVGITEREAIDRGVDYKVSKIPFLACGRAVAMSETLGVVKMICDAANNRVLGIHIMGPHADDLIAEGALALRLGATASDIAHTIHAHPTLSEAVLEAAMGHLAGAIHFQKM